MKQALAAQLAPWQARWRALARREQTLVLAAAAVVGFGVLWALLAAPALQTLRTAPARHAELDAQLQRMQALQAEARQLQGAPRVPATDAVRALQSGLAQRLGSAAQMTTAGDRATVTLKGVPADRLADWLAQARSAAHAVPLEMRLVRSAVAAAPATLAAPAAPAAPPGGAFGPGARPAPAAPPAPADARPRWDGTVVLALPAH